MGILHAKVPDMKQRCTSWIATLAFVLLAACSGEASDAPSDDHVASNAAALELTPECDASDSTKACSPHFDEVYRKGTHNAYWINNVPTPSDLYGAGTQMRLWDQLLHEHVRSIELDVHRDMDHPYGPLKDIGKHPGEFRVYHTDKPDNSTCFTLADCLQLLQRLDYVLPDHEVMHIVLELKQVDLPFNDIGLFDDPHFSPEEIDRLLWEHLGSRLYTPAEFMSRCDPNLNLRDCARQVGWPTVDQLRGRYIVTVHGTETPAAPGACNERSWWQYASADIRTRAAFPMFVVGGDAAGVSDFDLPTFKAHRYNTNTDAFKAMWRKALDNTIFFQLEDPSNPDFKEVPGQVPLYRQFHGVVRAAASFLVDHDKPRNEGDNFGDTTQAAVIFGDRFKIATGGSQIIMTDVPGNFINDVFKPQDADAYSLTLPSQVDRPFFEAADVAAADHRPDDPADPDRNKHPRRFARDDLREPGNRIYFDTANRIIEHDLYDWSDGPYPAHADRTNDPRRRGEGKIVRTAPARAQEPFEDWEVFPATSMMSHPSAVLQTTPFGKSCIDVGTTADLSGDLVRMCRVVGTDKERLVSIDTFVYRAGTLTESRRYTLNHYLVQDESKGDALRVLVDRHAASGTVVTLLTASEVNPDGTMHWVPLTGGGITFASDLRVHGLVQENDGVFTGTRLNGALVRFADFTPSSTFSDGVPGGIVTDLTYCDDGSCRGPRLSAESQFTDADGNALVGIHETEGAVYAGQWRTLLTPNRFEMVASGLHLAQRLNKFLLRKSAGTGSWLPLYRCIDWSRDLHVYWVDTSATCPNDAGPQGRNAGLLGYLSATPLSGTQPLYHLRKPTTNAGGPNTHDHYFAVGDAERAAKHGEDYVDVRPSGWSGDLPHPIGYVFTTASGVTQKFPVTIDGSDVTRQGFYVPGVSGWFNSKTAIQLQMSTGTYQLISNAMGEAVGSFQVRADGMVDFDPALDEVFIGRGTSTLKLRGYTVQIDARAVTSQHFYVKDATGWFSSGQVQQLKLAPGGPYAIISEATGDSIGSFTVKPDHTIDVRGLGTIDYAPALDGIFAGRNSGTLTLRSYLVHIDAHAVPGQHFYINGVIGWFDSGTVQNVKMLPTGPYMLVSEATGSALGFFRVTAASKVDYDASQASVFTGSGTGTLGLRPYTVHIDARALTAQHLYVNGVTGWFNSDTVQDIKVPTGGPYMVVSEATGSAVGTFRVNNNSKVDYDAAQETVFTGRGLGTLKLRAYTVHLDGHALAGQHFYVNGVLGWFDGATVQNMKVIAGGPYTVVSEATGSSIGRFSVSAASTVNYDASNEIVFAGRDSSTLVLLAKVVHLDARVLTAQHLYVNGVIGWFETQTVQELKLLVGGPYTVIAEATGGSAVGSFRVAADGTIDYEPQLDSVFFGHNGSTLFLRGYDIYVNGGGSAAPPQNLYINGVTGWFDSRYAQHLVLVPGGLYHVVAEHTGGADGSFSVSRYGTVEFDPAFNGIFDGAGTPTLLLR